MAKKDKAAHNLNDYRYVDCFHMNPQTGERLKWERMEIDKIEAYKQRHSNYNVFHTIQMYRSKVRQEGGGEYVYSPLFFDIDSSRTLAKDTSKVPHKNGLIEEGFVDPLDVTGMLSPQEHKELIAQLNNLKMLGIPLPDDACAKLNELAVSLEHISRFVWIRNLETSRSDVLKLLQFFQEKFSMTDDELRVYFSGSKGFHVIVNPVVMDVQPDRDLHLVFKFAAMYLEQQLKLRSLDTATIYGHARQLRMINSLHSKSGLTKIELTHEELRGSMNHIITVLAKAPRPDLYEGKAQEYTVNPELKTWYEAQRDGYEASKRLASDRVTLKDEVLSQMEGVPVCVQFMLERGILKNGDRNKATMALASYYKDCGTSEGETIRILLDWAKKIPTSMTSSSASEVEASTISCIRTVYGTDRYHFGCAFIRSLHGEREGRKYEAVPCAGRACPAHEDHAIDAVPAEFMHLAKTADAAYTGKKVSFNALVSGKMDTPYIVPKKVNYVCHHEPFCEKDCILHDYNGLMEKTFHENERFLIEATNQPDGVVNKLLQQHSYASCNKVRSDVLETENVTELMVVPMADRVSIMESDDGATSQTDQDGNEYVSRKIYAVGKPSEIPVANMHYKVDGYVYSHPKNAMATILTQRHEAKEDTISQFQVTDEIRKSFGVFQQADGETLDDRVSFIIDELAKKVTRVEQREEAHLALLMSYHSCLTYRFQGQLEKRGWMEVIFVGDSGQAKSLLVDNIMEYAGLGTRTSGELSSRTGLVYMLEQIGERWFIKWGSYPLSDRRLVVIDEFSEMPPDDFGKITEARTTGVLKVNRAGINTETNARVRLVMMSNPAKARTLASFTHGVEALKPLFASPADIRRLDLAVFLQSGDVPKSVLNAEVEGDDARQRAVGSDKIRPEVLRHSILWAWSRTADQIEITKAATKKLLEKANELGEKYGYAQDVPLMEPSDLRKKLARMAIALAALVHSTDETHEKVIVKPEHVVYVCDFIEVVYDNKNARLDTYSAQAREESELTEEERQLVTHQLNALDMADNAEVSHDMIELFRRNEILKPAELTDMLGYDKGQINARLSILSKATMINRTREGLRKMPKFIEYLTL